MKYCDGAPCPMLDGNKCKLGFKIRFRHPRSMEQVVHHDWGYVMPRVCAQDKRNNGAVKQVTK